MPIVDFAEIPKANTGTGDQDTFELFARDFFNSLGFEIIDNPSRGPDGGEDLIIMEESTSILGTNKVKWLVSCKHLAHSTTSVGVNDEINICDRVKKFHCDGFLGFYSTLPSNGLKETLNRLLTDFKVKVFDKELIEHFLLSELKLQNVFKRYFPKSFAKWREIQQSNPHKVFYEYVPLKCAVCGKDLLQDKSGIVVFVRKFDENFKIENIIDIYWACTGKCDKQLDRMFDEVTTWESISDLSIPWVYVRWITAALNTLRSGEKTFSDEAFEKFKHFTIYMSQIVFKETTNNQWKRIETLGNIPEFFGGLGEF